jgi:hypothetical protein
MSKTTANGTLNNEELIEIINIWQRYGNTPLVEYNLNMVRVDIAAVLAKRPASYTLEQIKAAVTDEFGYCQIPMPPAFLDDMIFRLTAPKPKTAEERIKDVLIKHVYISGSRLQPSDELVSELLLAALKESEAHNG